MSLFLGLDISTTATKALLVDDRGRPVATATSGYDLESPRLLWAEQDPGLWWRAAAAATREAVTRSGMAPERVTAIGLTGQMHGLVALDEAGEVLRPAILWNDQRAVAECDEMRRALGRDRLIAITGNEAFAGFTAPKLLWMRRHEPQLFGRIGQVLLPKDYVRFRLTGGFATDRAGAGGTLLLDLAARDWSAPLMQALELPADWFPPTHEGPEVTGALSAAAARHLGLAAGVPVVAGGGDQAAQAVGVGAIEAGAVALTLGTSGVVFAATDRPLTEPAGRLHAFPHAVPGRWHVMGVMLSAAGSLRWYRDTLAPRTAYDDLLAEAGAVAAGCDDLIFLPYLSGERTPHADAAARGAFLGLTLSHGRGHLTRSVLEGVAFGLRDNLALMAEVGLADITEVRLSGGGGESELWCQILADVLGVDLVRLRTGEAAAFGAALLAGVGAGHWATVAEACEQAVEITGRVAPDPSAATAYDAAYGRFTDCYPALRPLFDPRPSA